MAWIIKKIDGLFDKIFGNHCDSPYDCPFCMYCYDRPEDIQDVDE